LYRLHPRHVMIARVIHGSQDLARSFGPQTWE